MDNDMLLQVFKWLVLGQKVQCTDRTQVIEFIFFFFFFSGACCIGQRLVYPLSWGLSEIVLCRKKGSACGEKINFWFVSPFFPPFFLFFVFVFFFLSFFFGVCALILAVFSFLLVVVPHITDAIQEWVEKVASVPVDGDAKPPECCIIEVHE